MITDDSASESKTVTAPRRVLVIMRHLHSHRPVVAEAVGVPETIIGHTAEAEFATTRMNTLKNKTIQQFAEFVTADWYYSFHDYAEAAV